MLNTVKKRDNLSEIYCDQLQNILFQMPRRSGWKEYVPDGLRPSELNVIRCIDYREADGDITRIVDLAEQLAITSAAAANLVTSLERGGYLKREQSLEDGRAVLVKLTKAGMRVAAEARQQRREMLNELTGFLGEEDSKELLRVLSRVKEFFAERY